MYLRGEDISLGVGIETVRGTPVTPGMWIPGKSVATLGPTINKVNIRETRATKVSSQGSEIIQQSAAGSLEFYARMKSLGYILKSHLGSVATTTLETGVYQHVFTILPSNPQQPSLTLGLSQPNIQDYVYALALATALDINITPGDLITAKADFLAQSEATHAAYTPSYASDDYYFRHQDVTVKFASALSGLGAASATKVKDISFSSKNGAKLNQNVAELNPGDVLADQFEIGGSLTMDFQDTTQHDIFTGGTYKAVLIQAVRSDILLGTTNYPTIKIELPKVSFQTYSPSRPIDNIVSQKIGMMGHYSISDSLAVRITLINNKSDYNS